VDAVVFLAIAVGYAGIVLVVTGGLIARRLLGALLLAWLPAAVVAAAGTIGDLQLCSLLGLPATTGAVFAATVRSLRGTNRPLRTPRSV